MVKRAVKLPRYGRVFNLLWFLFITVSSNLLLNVEYEEAARCSVPVSQSGYAEHRMAIEQVVTLRLAQEQAMLEGAMLCICYIGMANIFMLCCREVQWEVERWAKVASSVTEIVQALHEMRCMGTVRDRVGADVGVRDPYGEWAGLC